MKIQRMSLLNQLKKAMPGVETGTTLLQGADTFVFNQQGIHSYNDSISVSVPMDNDTIFGAVKSKDFFNLLQKMKGDELLMAVKENKLIVKGGPTKAKINFVESSVSDYLANLNIKDLKWGNLPEDFSEGLKLCKIGSSHSSLRGVFAHGNILISTDEIRFNKYTMKSELPQFWIDDPAIVELMKIQEKFTHIALSAGWVHFKGESGTVFSCKRNQEESYPIKQIDSIFESLKASGDEVKAAFPKTFQDAVDRVSVLSEDINGFAAINITFTPGGIMLTASKQSGSVEETLDWGKSLSETLSSELKKDGGFTITADASFLKDAVTKSPDFYIKSVKNKRDHMIQTLVFLGENYTQLIPTIKEM